MSLSVDLSQLPAPKLVETLDFEAIYASLLADLQTFDPDLYNGIVASGNSDPAAKLLQVAAYREMTLRARINDAGLAVMLAYATGTDLDNIVAREPYNISRLVISEGDLDAVPPIPPVMENDEALRRRAQLAPSRFSTAGPEDAYVFHALTASGQVLDASAISPVPGQVLVSVLSSEGSGTASLELLETVADYFDTEPVRPLTDEVIVQSATVVEYAIEAELTLYDGPDEAIVINTALARLEAYRDSMRKLGHDIAMSGILGALHVNGVQNVSLTSPAANLVLDKTEVGYCTDITVSVVGRDE